MASPPRPSGLIATSGLELLTFMTGNGHKASILLEELKDAFSGKPEYAVQSISIFQGIQKEPWFTALGPNGKIPVLVDHDALSDSGDGPLAIMEGAAILSYLCRKFDTEGKFHFKEDPHLSVQEQWISWQNGGIGAVQGQANHFLRMSKGGIIPYAIQRFTGDTERLWGVLDTRLKDRDYLVGPGRGKYSVADIVNWTWINVGFFAGVEITDFPNVHRWYKAINARPAVHKGLNVPGAPFSTLEMHEKKMAEDAGYRESEEKAKKIVGDAKKEFGDSSAAL